MPATELTIYHSVGLHARPAALFVQTANRFESEIVVSFQEQTANAKSILDLLVLGAGQGATITVQADGKDAGDALSALRSLVESNFGEAQ